MMQDGRQQYLSYADPGIANGSYKDNALTADQGIMGFYNPVGSSGNQQANGIIRTAYPFSKTIFESSPLNRIAEKGETGAAWQPETSRDAKGRTKITEYGTNSKTDDVKLWTIKTNGTNSIVNYAESSLSKTTLKDENWVSGKNGTIEEFTDFEGRLILKRVWENDIVSLSTYYIYDDLGNLRYIVPPATTASSFTESETDNLFNQYIFAYHYDNKQRVVEKKIPGKGWEYIVYNKLGLIVMMQDAVQRDKESQDWTVVKYDGQGRQIITGIYKYGAKAINNYRVDIQTAVDAQANQWEDKVATGIGYSVDRTYPTAALSVVLSINYYDDYTAPGMPYYKSDDYSKMTKGLATATSVNVLGTATRLWTVNYYDDEARITKVYKQHYQSGGVNIANYDEITNNYNFAGELTSGTRIHRNGSSVTTIGNSYAYDHVGRAKTVRQKINTGTEVVLSKFSYNEIGQLLKKELHSTDDGKSFLQKMLFAYNERGWLKSEISDEFSMGLKYEDGKVPQYNGNISNQEWGAASSFSNVFSYTYDKLGRLKTGNSTGIILSEEISYDPIGNISTMNRDAGGKSTYNYIGSQLTSITGGSLATNTNYTYDNNGSAVKDGRTGVTLIYNLLNLPATATKTGLNLAYTYDATGNKLMKVSNGDARYYVDGIEYDNNNNIEIIRTTEGQARNNSGVYSYEYNLTDHLGNIRYSFYKNPVTNTLTRLQQTNYYPFGKASFVVKGNNKYLYNGKEIQEELGEQFDYGARFYDPVIARWNVVDKLADEPEQIDKSPYAYGWNNPVKNTDPDGNCPNCLIGALIGAAIDYGEQVAANYIEGKSNPWTKNINLVSIGTSAAAGFITSGGSAIQSVGAKLAVKAGASLVNNTIKVTTSSTGLKTEIETNAFNVFKNTAIDLGTDKVAGKLSGKAGGALSKIGVTNAGRLSSTSKAVVKALGVNVTRATTATVKTGLKAVTKVATHTVESSIKAATSSKAGELKTRTNQQ